MTNKNIIATYKAENNISCALHTYAKWQELGYQVRKGEKSQHRIVIWKACEKKSKDDEGNELKTSKLIQKTACFFTENQVEAIKA